MRSLRERFEEKFVKHADGCWLWTASVTGGGYGQIGLGGARAGRGDAHRVAWQLYRGPIPAGLFVLHRCDNKLCVNPDHLFLGTQADNMIDMCTKGRHSHHATRGEQAGLAKLTADQVRALRADYTAGARQVDLADLYGVGQSTVSSIVRRETWTDI